MTVRPILPGAFEIGEGEPVARKKPVQREHLLQVALKQYARDAIELPVSDWWFTAFDSAQKATDNQRARLIARGVTSGTPDCVLFIKNRLPIWTEAKWGRGTVSDEQFRVLHKLEDLGHHIGVVRSIEDYRQQLVMAKVPLRGNAMLIATDLDLKVAARIAKAEARVSTPTRPRKAAPRTTAPKSVTKRWAKAGLRF